MSRKDITRNNILDAAAKVFTRNPGASLNEIATAASLGRATVYRHFATREDLLAALALEAVTTTRDAIAPVVRSDLKGRAALEKVIEALVPLGDRYQFLMSEIAVYGQPEVAAGYERHLSTLNDLVSKVKKEGDLALDVPNAWIVSAIDALIWGAWSSVSEGYIAPRAAASLVTRTLFDGLKKGAS